MRMKILKSSLIKTGIIAFLVCILLLILSDGKVTKAVIEISSLQAKQRSSMAIDEAIKYNTEKMNLKTEDFFIYMSENAYSADLLVINEFSSGISSYITEYMKDMSKKEIEVPLGFLTGIDMFSNLGPCIKIYVMPVGSANVTTKSQVESAGINQVNYKIYLDIEIESKIVMPFKEKPIIYKRQVLLVDAVIKGDIPETYLHLAD